MRRRQSETLWSSPTAANDVTVKLPPYEINGNGIPVIGMIDMFMPALTIT
jgi:hypothetical protein